MTDNIANLVEREFLKMTDNIANLVETEFLKMTDNIANLIEREFLKMTDNIANLIEREFLKMTDNIANLVETEFLKMTDNIANLIERKRHIKSGLLRQKLCSLLANHSQKKTSGKGSDVVFVLDGSGSMGEDMFNKGKDLIVQFIDSVTIGPSYVQVGLYIDSSAIGSGAQFHLKSYHSGEDLKAAVNHIRRAGRAVHTLYSFAFHLVIDNTSSVRTGVIVHKVLANNTRIRSHKCIKDLISIANTDQRTVLDDVQVSRTIIGDPTPNSGFEPPTFSHISNITVITICCFPRTISSRSFNNRASIQVPLSHTTDHSIANVNLTSNVTSFQPFVPYHQAGKYICYFLLPIGGGFGGNIHEDLRDMSEKEVIFYGVWTGNLPMQNFTVNYDLTSLGESFVAGSIAARMLTEQGAPVYESQDDAQTLRDKGATIFTVDASSYSNTVSLQTLASSSKHHFAFYGTDTSDIITAILNIAGIGYILPITALTCDNGAIFHTKGGLFNQDLYDPFQ
ncbi:MATN2-like protein [Mya arenaria]|uniref:MATN2-like protein n=1 Tax=Mya arenaria TaxID=6604 RepID=A0ABY7E2P8_MYAAR|nr:MATN2-like protein [Mya arenaria]